MSDRHEGPYSWKKGRGFTILGPGMNPARLLGDGHIHPGQLPLLLNNAFEQGRRAALDEAEIEYRLVGDGLDHERTAEIQWENDE